MKSMTVSPSLSDLFFNHQHEHFEALNETVSVEGTAASYETTYQAIKKDAEEFVAQFAHLINEDMDSASLAQDFLDRL